jgi:TatD DNase family protein
MYVDSHCHLDRVDLGPYGNRFDIFMEETRRAGVERMLCVSINLRVYPAMRQLVEGYSDTSISVGVHPNEDGEPETSETELAAFARDPRVIAVGETGLDYHYHSPGESEWQRERFRAHIRAARAVGKPLIIHTREARSDTLRILREENAGEVGGVMHCFTEDWETARQALDLGFHISLSGIVTFRNADSLRDVARKVPADRYLIETDSPYLAPIPHRGKPNYPAYVRYVAECLATVRQIPEQRIAEQTARNFLALFRLE